MENLSASSNIRQQDQNDDSIENIEPKFLTGQEDECAEEAIEKPAKNHASSGTPDREEKNLSKPVGRNGRIVMPRGSGRSAQGRLLTGFPPG
jgi:hypothetical protein